MYNRLKDTENSKVLHDADMRAMAANEWARRVKDVAFQVTSRSRIRQELEKYNHGRISLEELFAFTTPKLSDAMDQSEEIIGITRMDRKGQLVAQCGQAISPSTLSIDYTQPFTISLSTPFSNQSQGTLFVSAPILNRSKTYLGADLIMIDLCALKKIVQNGLPPEDNRKVILGVLTEKGILTPFSKENIDNAGVPRDLLEAVLIKACRGQSGMDNISSDYVAAFHHLDSPDWGLVVLQNKKELYEPLNTRFICWGAGFFMAYLVILSGFWCLMSPLADRVLLHTDELKQKITEKTSHLEEEIKERQRAQAALAKTVTELEAANQKLKDLTGKLETANRLGKSGWWEYDVAGEVYTLADETYSIFELNRDNGSVTYADLLELIHPDYIRPSKEALIKMFKEGEAEFEYQACLPKGNAKWLWITGKAEYGSNNKAVRIFGSIQDITESKNAQIEKEQLIRKLQDALEKVNVLSGLVPICANCKKIRDDKGFWNNLETYIQNHSSVLFSHAICPECTEKLYGKYEWYTNAKKKSVLKTGQTTDQKDA